MGSYASDDQLREADGSELGVGDWIEVTQEKIDAFAALTGDEQWIHVDVERAAASELGSTFAHGYLVLALVAPAVMGLIQIDDARQLLNYGMNRVRFPAPVRVGSRVRGRLTLTSVTDSGTGFLVDVAAVVEVEGQSKPGCVAQVLTYVDPVAPTGNGDGAAS